VRLLKTWRDRYGYLPPLGNGALTGLHFNVTDGRALVLLKPDRLHAPGWLVAQAFTLIAAKQRVETVRLANTGELPKLKPRNRIPDPRDEQSIEQWPPLGEHDLPVVVEFVGAAGTYLHRDIQPSSWWPPCSATSLDEALTFASSDEAAEWLADHPHTYQLGLRYLAAALAELDQQEAALLDELRA
jgi:hypothetical protein